MGEREIDVQLRERRHQLGGEPAGREEIELPADLGAAPAQALDARQELRGQARLVALDGRHVDAHPEDAELLQALELGIGSVFIEVDDAAGFFDSDFAHRIEHTAVVASVGGGLH